MKSKSEKILEFIVIILGFIIGLLSFVFIIFKQYWAFYIQLSLIFPYWCLVSSLLVVKIISKRKDTRK